MIMTMHDAIPNVQNTAFWAQIHIVTTRKRSKIIATGTFPGLKTIKIAFAAYAPPRTPLEELTALHQTL